MKNFAGSNSKLWTGSPDYSMILGSLSDDVIEVASSLRPEDLEVLVYLMVYDCSYQSNNSNSNRRLTHCQCKCVSLHSSETCDRSSIVEVYFRNRVLVYCNCFHCYTSYWGRWDASPNRAKIDEAIALFEDNIHRISKQQNDKSYNKSSDLKGEKRQQEGKGRGRKFQKEQKYKDVKVWSKVDKGKSNCRASTHSADCTVFSKEQSSEFVLLAEKEIQQNPLWIIDMEAFSPPCIRQQEKCSSSSSSSKSLPRNLGKCLQGSKEKVAKEVKVKSSRVAPCSGESVTTEQNDKSSDQNEKSKVKTSRLVPCSGGGDETVISTDQNEKCNDQIEKKSGSDSSEVRSDEHNNSTTLNRGKKLMNFVASRLWGFWDRPVESVVDVY